MTPIRFAFILFALLVAAGAAFYFWPRNPPPPPPGASAPAPAAPATPAGPKHPIAAPAQEQPLPPLKESDAAMREALTGLAGSGALEKFLNLEDIVRRIVATIDNLTRESYATRLNPVKPIGGTFVAAGKEGALEIAPRNAARYSAFLAFAESIDTKRMVELYVRYYPLFQQAYVELGYPNGYFNDRLVQVLDHLVATPEVAGPIKLAVPHVLYEFADPELEERSSGQKAIIRMGAENAARAKAKLREIRAEVLARGAKR